MKEETSERVTQSINAVLYADNKPFKGFVHLYGIPAVRHMFVAAGTTFCCTAIEGGLIFAEAFVPRKNELKGIVERLAAAGFVPAPQYELSGTSQH